MGAPKAVILAPPGGANIVSGIGVFTGGINPRAVAVLWRAGEESLMDDVRFLGGHGSGAQSLQQQPHRRSRPAQALGRAVSQPVGHGWRRRDICRHLDAEHFRSGGLSTSRTRKRPGTSTSLSNEHHVRNEIKFDHVENWDINAPQTEEEAGESPESLSLEIRWSQHIYDCELSRLSRNAFARAVPGGGAHLSTPSNIHFRNVHVNAESGYATCDDEWLRHIPAPEQVPYENAIQDMTHHLEVREREFAVLDIPADPAEAASSVMRPLC